MLAIERSISRAMISSTMRQDEQRLLGHAGGGLREVEALAKLGTASARRRAAPAVSDGQEGLPAREPLGQASRIIARLARRCGADPTKASIPIGDQDDQAVDALQPERIDPRPASGRS